MDNDPFTILENGYRKVNLLEFLLNREILRQIYLSFFILIFYSD